MKTRKQKVNGKWKIVEVTREIRRRKRRTRLTRSCAWCYSPFETSRDHAKFCSAKCRVSASRQKARDEVAGYPTYRSKV